MRKRRRSASLAYLTGHWLNNGGLCSIPQRVIRGPDFQALSHAGRTMLIAVVGGYSGCNNRAIPMTQSIADGWGLTSKATVQRCVKQLLEAGLIVQTRIGYAGLSGQRQAALYGLAWLPVDDVDARASDGSWLPEIRGTHSPPRTDFSRPHDGSILYSPA